MIRRLCSAKRTNGEPCKGLAMDGQKVCRVHGGSAPQTMAAAKLRLAALVDPAIDVLAYAMKQKAKQLPSAITAARDALDRAGHKPKDVIEATINPERRSAELQAGRERARKAALRLTEAREEPPE
jgi:hypothetical protein